MATGFLRMAPDATWANITGFVPDRLEVIADEIDVLGSAVMGLTLKCARCHSHKFDPIPQRDYYRLLAVFKGAYDEYDWLKPDIRPGDRPRSARTCSAAGMLPYVTTAERKALGGAQTRQRPKGKPAGAARSRRCGTAASRRRPTSTAAATRCSPGRLVGPGVPSVLTDGKTPFEVQAALARREDRPAGGWRSPAG